MKTKIIPLLLLSTQFAVAQNTKVANALDPAPFGAVEIGGFVGARIDSCIQNRLIAQDIEDVVKPFRDRPDEKWGFRSEFWGKWFTAAMLGYGYKPTPEYRKHMDEAVEKLIETQDESGYIGTYLTENHLGEWDVWGRKYVMLGLLAYYDQTGDKKVLKAACKVADNLIDEAGPNSGVNIAETGWIGWKGLAPSSVLEPISLLYQRTGEKKYLDFAEHIVKCWDKPNKLTPQGIQLIQEAINEKPMWKMSGAPKAYEMMSCFEGLCELYRITGNHLYYEACHKLIDNIIRDEIVIVGSGSQTEIWCHGKLRQTEPVFQGMETCVTATWMKFLYQMLRLTGESKYADEMETCLYNALLASMTPDGSWWCYYTSLQGERFYSHQQFADVGLSCCVANGPRGLLTLPYWATMTSKKGATINFYGNVKSNLSTPSGKELSIDMKTAYPEDGKIRMEIGIDKAENFSIDLRIPGWSKKNRLTLNGTPLDTYLLSGTYASIQREWKNGDVLELELDMRGRVIEAPSGLDDEAIARGPIVLAFDTRLVPIRSGVTVPPMLRYEFDSTEDGYIDLERTEGDPAMWMVFNVPLKDEGGYKHTLPMCDYVSAGNTWQDGNRFRVWIQQPFDFRHLYTNNLDWRTNAVDGMGRTVIPEKYRRNK